MYRPSSGDWCMRTGVSPGERGAAAPRYGLCLRMRNSSMRYEPRKKIRLPREAYSVAGSVWFTTITTWDRTPLFRSPMFADVAQEELRRQHDRRGTRLLVYCVM